jgi:hypothetical protein
MDNNPYAPPRANLDAPGRPGGAAEAPALWNPAAAARWSLLFSPIFGAAIHMKNWQALGEPEKAATSRTWLIACLALSLLLLASAFVLPDSPALDILSRVAGFGMLIAWYVGSAKRQVSYVAERFGTTYPRRGWGMPLLYGTLVYVAIFVAAFAGLLAIDTLAPGEE